MAHRTIDIDTTPSGVTATITVGDTRPLTIEGPPGAVATVISDQIAALCATPEPTAATVLAC